MSTPQPDRRGSAAFRGYGSPWVRAREYFLWRNPNCAMCSTPARPVEAKVVDHIIPPRLGEAKRSGDHAWIDLATELFWDRDNWQPLCTNCHSSTKQRLEKSGRLAGCDESGRPLDPRHHWHRQG